jgi:hypothetical protein
MVMMPPGDAFAPGGGKGQVGCGTGVELAACRPAQVKPGRAGTTEGWMRSVMGILCERAPRRDFVKNSTRMAVPGRLSLIAIPMVVMMARA